MSEGFDSVAIVSDVWTGVVIQVCEDYEVAQAWICSRKIGGVTIAVHLVERRGNRRHDLPEPVVDHDLGDCG